MNATAITRAANITIGDVIEVDGEPVTVTDVDHRRPEESLLSYRGASKSGMLRRAPDAEIPLVRMAGETP